MELSRDAKYALSVLDSIQDYFGDSSSANRFPIQGTSLDQIRSELNLRLRQDNQYSEGKILGAMSTPPHPFAKEIYAQYIDRNLGDRGLNPATCTIEHEVVTMMGDLLHGHNLVGNLTSGGTESNLIAMFLAKQNSSHISKPNIVVPESAHYSFTKAALLMGLELRKVPLTDYSQVNVDEFQKSIDHNTIAMVGVAGTSSLGVVDPIEILAEIAQDHHIHFHVDGAFGGLVLPFLSDLGVYDGPRFDFRVDGISSYTVDPHKMGLNVNPSGGILLNPDLIDLHSFKIPYLAGGGVESFNLLGTRPGAAAISFWALIRALGIEGFREIVKVCWQNTQYAFQRIQTLPQIQAIQPPIMNIIGIYPSPELQLSINEFNAQLRQQGWALGQFRNENLLRMVMMPHVSQSHLDSFFDLVANF